MQRDKPPGWLLDERSSAGRENLDVDHVARYDQKEDARADSEVSLLASLGLDESSTVVDLGAGTGQFALAAAQRCARVVAVDVSPVMLGALRAKVSESSQANIEVVEAGFLSYEHRGAPASFVYTRWALHHLTDFWKAIALTRMRSILEPGGILRLSDIVYSFEPAQAAERIEQWCDTLPVDAPEGEWVRSDIEEHVRHEDSTFAWILEPMIKRTGFRIETTEYSADGFLAEYVATAV